MADMDSAIQCYKSPANMNPRHYADDLYAKSCKVANVYDESMLNLIFIKAVDSSICSAPTNMDPGTHRRM